MVAVLSVRIMYCLQLVGKLSVPTIRRPGGLGPPDMTSGQKRGVGSRNAPNLGTKTVQIYWPMKGEVVKKSRNIVNVIFGCPHTSFATDGKKTERTSDRPRPEKGKCYKN